MIETKFQTIYRYAREALDNSQIRETALAMIAHIAKDEIAEPQLTEAESQLVLGAMPLRELPNGSEPRCSYCGETKANHGDYASGEDWVCPEPRTQPASSDEEKWTLESEPIHGWTIHGNKRIIARGIYREEDAREIIHNHQLAALVPRLVTALESLAVNSSDNTGLCWCVTDPRVFGHCNQCEQIRVIVTTASKEQK